MIKQLKRRFIIGASNLPDPAPNMPLSTVKEMLAQQYPMLRHTEIFESDGVASDCGEFIDYKVVTPPPKTQG